MRAPTDLHPGDAAHRAATAARLRAIREAQGMSAGRLAAILGFRDHSGVRQMERRHTWRADTLARWARALNHHVTYTITDLTVPDDSNTLAAVYTTILDTPDVDPTYIDQTVVRQTVNDLARIRRSVMSAPAFGRLIGLDDKTVLWREANPDGTTVSAMQQTARGLGGHLTVDLTPVRTTSHAWSVAA